MSLRSIFKGAMLVTASAALIAVITIAGILALAFYSLTAAGAGAFPSPVSPMP